MAQTKSLLSWRSYMTMSYLNLTLRLCAMQTATQTQSIMPKVFVGPATTRNTKPLH
ncbi:hypothetical protein [Methylotenera sp.]|uniref:hypothetical protein n=1 Tax=Methylotenera sp. TaxID=2051956 RepID=UPI00248A08F6|nr:hypothetical protein [Methylotenera sp.]MDI1362526.1 hypothetical protein [Methylotenera sp.]